MASSSTRGAYWPLRYGSERYWYATSWEKGFSSVESTNWMLANWHHSISISLAYVALIFVGRWWMRNKEPYQLQMPLLAWNATLAVFSLIGTIRNAPELLWAVREHGFLYSICTCSFAEGVTGFWTQAFAFSKVVELLDTAFIVLRKRPLTFLHCYHHCTVLVYTWHAYKDYTASGRWFIVMNYSVHALMYTYYALMTAKWFHIPRRFSMFVTLCQLTQMVIGVWIGVTLWRMGDGERASCQQTQKNLYLTFAIYFSYFVLFSNFFFQAYFRNKKAHRSGTKVALASGVSNMVGKLREEDASLIANGSATTAKMASNGLHSYTGNGITSNYVHINGGTSIAAAADNEKIGKPPMMTRLRYRMQHEKKEEGCNGSAVVDRKADHSG